MKSKLLLTYLQNTSENLEDIRELVLLLRASSEKTHRQDGTKYQGMNIISMVIVLHVTVLVTRLWTIHSMEEYVVEVPIKQLDVGPVITLSMFLQISTP